MSRVSEVEKLIAKISRGTAPSMTCANAIERDGHLLPDRIDDLAVTRVGLALAAQAWSEGRAEGRRQGHADYAGVTREHERNPYSAELCKIIKAEEHANDQ